MNAMETAKSLNLYTLIDRLYEEEDPKQRDHIKTILKVRDITQVIDALEGWMLLTKANRLNQEKADDAFDEYIESLS